MFQYIFNIKNKEIIEERTVSLSSQQSFLKHYTRYIEHFALYIYICIVLGIHAKFASLQEEFTPPSYPSIPFVHPDMQST